MIDRIVKSVTAIDVRNKKNSGELFGVCLIFKSLKNIYLLDLISLAFFRDFPYHAVKWQRLRSATDNGIYSLASDDAFYICKPGNKGPTGRRACR